MQGLQGYRESINLSNDAQQHKQISNKATKHGKNDTKHKKDNSKTLLI